MASAELIKVDNSRTVISGLELPDPPPTRVYLSGRLYRLAPTPQVPLPPIANVVKVIWNWLGPLGRIAKNIQYLQLAGGAVSSDPATLVSLANGVMSSFGGTVWRSQISHDWTLSSVTCKDCGGTSAIGNSTAAASAGTHASDALPPQCTTTVSWQIAESYRGGKPRQYTPGVPTSVTNTPGGSDLTSTYCVSVAGAANAFMAAINSFTVTGPVGATCTLGTVSYHTGHSLRPTPLFRQFIRARVHERLDSQRRRSGPESGFPVTP